MLSGIHWISGVSLLSASLRDRIFQLLVGDGYRIVHQRELPLKLWKCCFTTGVGQDSESRTKFLCLVVARTAILDNWSISTQSLDRVVSQSPLCLSGDILSLLKGERTLANSIIADAYFRTTFLALSSCNALLDLYELILGIENPSGSKRFLWQIPKPTESVVRSPLESFLFYGFFLYYYYKKLLSK